MSKIITVGREFGSGGRELARRLAETLQIAYYDQEIVQEIARRTSLSENYIHQVMEQRPYPLFPITIGHTLYPREEAFLEQAQSVYKEQSNLIREMAAQSDCIIVGRCADYILREEKPFRIFVCAEMESRMKRCRERATEQENFSDKELRQHIQRIDKNRASYYEFYTGRRWGDKINYELCINTTNTVIKDVVPVVARLFA